MVASPSVCRAVVGSHAFADEPDDQRISVMTCSLHLNELCDGTKIFADVAQQQCTLDDAMSR
jgi:hypothetical protein